MAIQDDFIGNLRENKRGISDGLNGLRQAPQAQAPRAGLGIVGSSVREFFGPRAVPLSGWSPREIDKPNLEEQNRAITNIYGNRDGARNGMRFVIPTDKQKSLLENNQFDAYRAARLPRTTQEWDNFENNIGSFENMLKEYNNEPNQSKRMDLLKRSASAYANVPRLSGYIEMMYADEDANKNGRYNDFDYRRVQKDVEDAIQMVLSYRYSNS